MIAIDRRRQTRRITLAVGISSFCLLAVCLLVDAVKCEGQQVTKATGVVKTNTGETPDDVKVRALDSKTGRCVKEVKTAAGGLFSISYLSANTYDVGACQSSTSTYRSIYIPALRKGVKLEEGEEKRIDPPLVLAVPEESTAYEDAVGNTGEGVVVCLIHRETGCILDHKRTDENGHFQFNGMEKNKAIYLVKTYGVAGISKEDADRRHISLDKADYDECVKYVAREQRCP